MISSRILAVLAPLSVVCMAAGQYFLWMHAPEEASMGLVQKIFYFHLPLAWWSFGAFFGVFVCSIGLLRTGRGQWDLWAAALAEMGVLACSLALVTGSIWGRASWNTWWTWDPRLSTTLVMWFVYSGYLVLRAANTGGSKGARVRAVLGIVAFLDVPLVFLSARLWRSIHPAVFASQGGGLTPEMWTAVWINAGAWGVLLAALVLVRHRNLVLRERVDGVLAGIRETY